MRIKRQHVVKSHFLCRAPVSPIISSLLQQCGSSLEINWVAEYKLEMGAGSGTLRKSCYQQLSFLCCSYLHVLLQFTLITSVKILQGFIHFQFLILWIKVLLTLKVAGYVFFLHLLLRGFSLKHIKQADGWGAISYAWSSEQCLSSHRFLLISSFYIAAQFPLQFLSYLPLCSRRALICCNAFCPDSITKVFISVAVCFLFIS